MLLRAFFCLLIISDLRLADIWEMKGIWCWNLGWRIYERILFYLPGNSPGKLTHFLCWIVVRIFKFCFSFGCLFVF